MIHRDPGSLLTAILDRHRSLRKNKNSAVPAKSTLLVLACFANRDEISNREMPADRTHGGARSYEWALAGSVTRLSREHVLIDLLRIAQHDKAKVVHVLLRDALHVGGRDCAQLFQKE